jgi:uncharacterized protein YndB with AHSA1/START domain
MAKVIKHQYFFAHPVETVWEYLTNSELMGQWLMKNDFLPIIGHEFQFRTGAKANLNFDGIFYCKVLEIEPLKKISLLLELRPGRKQDQPGVGSDLAIGSQEKMARKCF